MWAVEKAFRALACRTDIKVGVSSKRKKEGIAGALKKIRISMNSHHFSSDHVDGFPNLCYSHLSIFMSFFLVCNLISMGRIDCSPVRCAACVSHPEGML